MSASVKVLRTMHVRVAIYVSSFSSFSSMFSLRVIWESGTHLVSVVANSLHSFTVSASSPPRSVLSPDFAMK